MPSTLTNIYWNQLLVESDLSRELRSLFGAQNRFQPWLRRL